MNRAEQRGRVRPWIFLPLIAVVLLALFLRSRTPSSASLRFQAMDTSISFDLTGPNSEEAAQAAMDRVYDLDRSFTATSGSPIFDLNNAGGDWSPLDQDCTDLLELTLGMSRLTGGALDPTAYSAVRAWGFTVGKERIPDPAELADLITRIDYRRVELDREGRQARLPRGMALDLGAVAKGYAGDQLAAQLEEAGITSALLSLGDSSIQTVGAKPDGSPWRIGIRDPQSDGPICVVEMADQAMGTSAGYQRFFDRNGVRYWHIMDPKTASPARSGLSSVSVVSKSGLLCDGLSTALFVMGEENALALWRDHPELEFDVVLIRDDGSLAITAGLEDSFSLASAYRDRKVDVLR